jgi:hypothetical protein
MIAILLIALTAGCASALMFASIISGALVSLLLCYLAPLPLMVAAIGWGPWSATIGGTAAAAALAAILGVPFGLAYGIGVALPACWLGHLVLLGRPIPADGASAAESAAAVEWYPVGRILLWIAGFSALTTFAALLTLGIDALAIADVLRRGLLRLLGLDGVALSDDIERWIDASVTLAPSAGVMVGMLTLTLNLWLAARINLTSGRLHRPWPDVHAMTLPEMTPAALCVTVAFCFSGGLLGITATICTAALAMAFAFVGFAVLHVVTLPLRNRALWLGAAYVVVLAFTWPMLAVAAVGLADTVFGLRLRYLRGRPPPLPVP